MSRIRCPLCEGPGWDPNSPNLTKCPKCKGDGAVDKPRWSGPADITGHPGGGGLLTGIGLVPAWLHRPLRQMVGLTILPFMAAWVALIVSILVAAGLTFLMPVGPFLAIWLGIASAIRCARLFDRLARCPYCGGRCVVEPVPGAPTKPESTDEGLGLLRRYRCLRCGASRELGYEPLSHPVPK